MINRRKLLKQFVVMGAGIALVPACLQDKSKSSILLKNVSISAGEEKLLAELCESIIPKTNTPGAKDISAHLFVLKMIDDCAVKEDREKFVRGITAFTEFSKTVAGKHFIDCSGEERKNVLKQLLAVKDEKSDPLSFFKTVKRYTIQAYSGSEFYLTKVQVYQLVPGRYRGCVPVKA